jgi:hypothetical protein
MKRKFQLRGLALAATLLAIAALLVSPSALAQDPPSEPPPTQEPTQQPTQQDPSRPQEPDQPTQPMPSQPKPAGRGNPGFNDDEEIEAKDPNALKPDTTALTGVLVPTVGSPEMRHSYFVPGLQYGNFIRSTSLNAPTVTDWNSTSYVAGSVSLLERWSHAQMSVNYSGGGLFSTDKSQGNSSFHQLNFVQTFETRRWRVSFVDDFSYLPQTQFGFAASSIFEAPGISGPLGSSLAGLQSSYQPSQSIFSSLGNRYSNSITAETAYQVSARGSFTLAGSYGILRFAEAGNIDTNDAIFSTGYDYALTKNDTVGLLYRFTSYRFLGAPQSIQDHTAEFAYGRKVTGRLSVQFFVGPEITEFRQPLGGSDQRVSAAGGANVTYWIPRTTLTASYSHGVSGGSGVFTGSITDQLESTISRHLSRVWTGQITFGYARNSNLGTFTGTSNNSIFDSWFAGGALQRPIGRSANASFGYTGYIETSSLPRCSTGDCGSFVQHQISLSLQWHTRPFVLR